MASARARLLSMGGRDKGVVGILGASHLRLSWAALVILMTGQEGSDTLTHVRPVHSLERTARESRQCRNAGHMRGDIKKLAPGGLWSRRYKGIKGLVRPEDLADVRGPHQ